MKPIRTKSPPNRVAILQVGTVRDCLLTIPLAVDIRCSWPNAVVCWVAESPVTEILESHACIDSVICLKPGWMRRPKEWKRLRTMFRQLEIDCTFDPLGLNKSALLSLMAGARTRIGFSRPMGRELSPWLATHRVHSRHHHRIDTIRELMSPWFEVRSGQANFLMPVFPEALQRVKPLLHDRGFSEGSRWCVIHPGAIWPTARWPVEKFARLTDLVYQQHGLRSIITWSDEEERLLSEVIQENSQGSAVVAPRLSITENLELLRCAQLLVCGDCLPLQLASSIGVPCVSLHGPTWADEFGAYGVFHLAVQSPSPLLSRKMSRRGPNLAMHAIEVEEVLHSITRVLCRYRDRAVHPAAA